MLTKEMELLVIDNMALAGHIAKKFLSTGLDYDELRSLAYLGLVKAANAFDVGKSCKFTSFAGTCMNNEILMFLRQNKKHLPCVSYDALMEDGETAFIEVLGDEDPVLNRIDNIGWYDALTWNLSDREKQVVDLVIIRKKRQEDVSREVGVSQSYISRIKKDATRKMKMAL